MDYMSSIKEIIPITISKIHDELVRYLLTTGDDKVVHSKRVILIKNKMNMLLKVEAFFSLNIHYPNEFPYIVFVKPIIHTSGHFIVNHRQ